MATETFTIIINDDYVTPDGTFDTNEAYLTFVMNKAAESYRNGHGTDTPLAGITAAREAYNAAVSPTE